jgi:hypothetical protein
VVLALQLGARMLRREVLSRPSRLGRLVAAAVLVGIGGAAYVNHIVVTEFGESKSEVARYRAKEIAKRGCYVGAEHDPWGEQYRVYCGRYGVVVQSLGEDGVSLTADDIWSNR